MKFVLNVAEVSLVYQEVDSDDGNVSGPEETRGANSFQPRSLQDLSNTLVNDVNPGWVI